MTRMWLTPGNDMMTPRVKFPGPTVTAAAECPAACRPGLCCVLLVGNKATTSTSCLSDAAHAVVNPFSRRRASPAGSESHLSRDWQAGPGTAASRRRNGVSVHCSLSGDAKKKDIKSYEKYVSTKSCIIDSF